jgi:[ribosomal protein S5]-alanine N-acetyltransferase
MEVGRMLPVIETQRLVLRPWADDDAPAALTVYGEESVASSLAPTMERVIDLDHMRSLLRGWAAEDATPAPTGHWAIEARSGRRVVGGLTLQFMPLGSPDVHLGWALTPLEWGNGYATEAGVALTRWVLHETDVTELFAVLQADNARAAATARRIGMEWVRETGRSKLQVYRIRHADLARTGLDGDEAAR